jgi:glycosyltransferase involved in cell wall biosynthesis
VSAFKFNAVGQPPGRRGNMPSSKPAVCIIVENLPVPFDRRVWHEARTLAEAGYTVSVISPKGRGYTASREVVDGVEVLRHRTWEASGIFGYLIEYPWALASELLLALRVYRRTRFRILHACNPPDLLFLVWLFFRPFGVRFIFDHHDLNPELYEAKFGHRGLGYRLLRLAERLTFRCATVSIATNESFRQVAIRRGGMAPDRVFVVRSVPELSRACLRSPEIERKEGRRFLVVYLGVMERQDGLDLLLDSVAEVKRRRGAADVLFVLIGSGTELPRLQALSHEKGLDDLVRFTGALSESEVAAYLSTADLCVAPDPWNPMNDQSTMNKIFRYMAYARPVVLYDLTEGRRSAGDAALYAKPNDPVDFAAQIIKLLNSEALRNELGQRGRRRIEGGLNWETEKKTLLEAYEVALQ